MMMSREGASTASRSLTAVVAKLPRAARLGPACGATRTATTTHVAVVHRAFDRRRVRRGHPRPDDLLPAEERHRDGHAVFVSRGRWSVLRRTNCFFAAVAKELKGNHSVMRNTVGSPAVLARSAPMNDQLELRFEHRHAGECRVRVVARVRAGASARALLRTPRPACCVRSPTPRTARVVRFHAERRAVDRDVESPARSIGRDGDAGKRGERAPRDRPPSTASD